MKKRMRNENVPMEKKNKKWQTEYRTAQPFTLAFFQTWGIHRSWSYQLADANIEFLLRLCKE